MQLVTAREYNLPFAKIMLLVDCKKAYGGGSRERLENFHKTECKNACVGAHVRVLHFAPLSNTP